MKRSSRTRIGMIAAAALALIALGSWADRWMQAQSGESLGSSWIVMVLVGTAGLISSVIVKDRQRPVARADAGTRADALAFQPRPGQACVVVFRDDRMGAQLGADVSLDGRLHTQLTSPGFTLADLAPGAHRIAVDWNGHRTEHQVELREGDTLALHLRMRMGLTTTVPSLVAVPPDQARRTIGKAPMALPITEAA